jgi:gluconokinase
VIIVLSGVSGAGKTTTGQMLSTELNWPFYEADDFHPASNIERMSRGEPLTDRDRAPWLERLASLIGELTRIGTSAVIACSALKQAYRDKLISIATPASAVKFVYLRLTPEEATRRLKSRPDHFMPASLEESQFADLEEPAGAIVIDATLPPEVIARRIRSALRV